ncbi:cytochrome c oxidase assembly protein [Porticoccus sp. W117]|uniref:cytochrome c oxidase assembly protein n=1 Tax=Porticoccus sp. W117 TaxID=3054777 RepID=UPI0025947BB4|nr:cytochrome c oxidase assembly protein [Porticoccus sp. W117]MDM3870819.1 cytochrome c oxidase assembly protein [Porticoccus sp. W117]
MSESTATTNNARSNANRRIVLGSVGVAVGMLIFCFFVLPPLYDALCDLTGLNAKIEESSYEAVPAAVDTSRTVKVQFLATNNESMPWQFGPALEQVRVHPGEQTTIEFVANNTTGNDMVAQAVPSVVPFKAVDYFHKMECFCFERQPLKAGESAKLPMVFTIDPELPKQIHTITLSYTLFDVTEMDAKASGGSFQWGKG